MEQHEQDKTSRSVLFSLGELRDIEVERLESEAAQRRDEEVKLRAAEEHAAVAAAQAVEQARREACERAEREAARRRHEAREERLRLEETERRARVAAEVARSGQRLAREKGHGASRRLLLGAVAAAAVLALAVALLLIYQVGAQKRQRQHLADLMQQFEVEQSKAQADTIKLASLRKKISEERRIMLEKALHEASKPAAVAVTPKRDKDTKRSKGRKGNKSKGRKGKGKGKGKVLLTSERCKNDPDPLCGMKKTKGRGY